VKQAHAMNYRSRAAFKLIAIDARFKLLHAGMTVLECGAAPGGWTQV
jgi:23S rRNA (uridine2552-2'-O)-methyltransferase